MGTLCRDPHQHSSFARGGMGWSPEVLPSSDVPTSLPRLQRWGH